MRQWMGVYCNSHYEKEVMNELRMLYERLKLDRPEYQFDIDQTWEECDEDGDKI